MKNLFFLLLVLPFVGYTQTYGSKIVGRGLSQQGHWVYSPSSQTTSLEYDSVYYVDINWRQAFKATGGLFRVVAKSAITGGAVVVEYFLIDATRAGATLVSTASMGATAGLGTLWALAKAEDCRWNNVKEIPKDEYVYDMSHYGNIIPFWLKHPLIQ